MLDLAQWAGRRSTQGRSHQAESAAVGADGADGAADGWSAESRPLTSPAMKAAASRPNRAQNDATKVSACACNRACNTGCVKIEPITCANSGAFTASGHPAVSTNPQALL